MIKLRHLFIILALLSLAACDDQAAKPATQLQQEFAANNAQPHQGIEQLKARLVTNPNDFETLSALADMYFESGQYVDAILTYDKALIANPMCADCYNDKGLASHYLGNTEAAIESFDKAVAIDPVFVHAWLSKGFVLISAGRYQEAIEPLNKVKELDTTGGLTVEADKFLAIAAQNGAQ